MGSALMIDFLRLGGALSRQFAGECNSPACETRPIPAGFGRSGDQKTRPSAQYDANGLASPGH
jgi:hypothetical protein